MRFMSKMAATSAALVMSVTLTGAPVSADVTPLASGIAYGFTPKSPTPISGAECCVTPIGTAFDNPVRLYDGVGFAGMSATVGEDWRNLGTLYRFNDYTSSIGNWGTGFDLCFYAHENYTGRWIWLRKDAAIDNLANDNWLDNQITSLRAAPAPRSC